MGYVRVMNPLTSPFTGTSWDIHPGVFKTKRRKVGKLFAAIGSYGLIGVAMSVVAGTFHSLCQPDFKVANVFFKNFLIGSLAIRTKASVAKKTKVTTAVTCGQRRWPTRSWPLALPMECIRLHIHQGRKAASLAAA